MMQVDIMKEDDAVPVDDYSNPSVVVSTLIVEDGPMTMPTYSYEDDPNLLKAELDFLSTPASAQYGDRMYEGLQNIQGQCRADFMASCGMPNDIAIAVNNIFNEFLGPQIVFDRKRKLMADIRLPSRFHTHVAAPLSHAYNAIMRHPVHEEVLTPQVSMESVSPEPPSISGAPIWGGSPPLVAEPPVVNAAIDENRIPFFTLRTPSAVNLRGMNEAEIMNAPVRTLMGGPHMMEHYDHPHDHEHDHEGHPPHGPPPPPQDGGDLPPPPPPHGGLHNGPHDSSSEGSGNSAEESNSSDSPVSPEIFLAPRDQVMAMPAIDFGTAELPVFESHLHDHPLPGPPGPPMQPGRPGANSGRGPHRGRDDDGQDDDSSSSSSESGAGGWWGHPHHGARHQDPRHGPNHDHHGRPLPPPPPEMSMYTGSLGFGSQGDSCMYSKFDTLSSPCQNAILDMYALRSDYEQEVIQSSGHHCHGHFLLIVLALFVISRIFMRKHRQRRQQVVSLLKALEANPALKAQVEAETGVQVPPAPNCSGAKCCRKLIKAISIFILSVLLGFFLVIFSLVVAGNIIQMMAVNTETGEVSYPEPSTALLIVGVVFLGNTLLLVSLASLVCAGIQKFRAARQARSNNTVQPAAEINSSGSSPSDSGACSVNRPCIIANLFGRLRQLVPARPTNMISSSDRGLYTPLVGNDTQTEMVSFEQLSTTPSAPTATVYSLPQQYPHGVAMTAMSHGNSQSPFTATSPATNVVYVPVSAQAMSTINML